MYLFKTWVFLLIIALIQSCAPVSVQHPQPPFGYQEIADILLTLKNQENAVYSFLSSGRITVQIRGSEFDADVLIIGKKTPLNLKLEITHPWGRPLFHAAINENRLQFLSFPDKKYFIGDIRELVSSRFLPLRLETDQLWAIGRGLPVLRNYKSALSFKGNQISLFNTQGEMVQVIDFYEEISLPYQSILPEQSTTMSFSGYRNDENIQYAKKIGLIDHKEKATLAIDVENIVFNKTVDESIFELTVPPDFEFRPIGLRLDTR